ncbi:MAG: hypothetical protein Q4C88_07695 [Akkermansia sp.]|nr:hypothetical protein [Akkermansia sp.]
MKLHLPKMLAAAVLAAITSVGNLTTAAEPVDATFTTTNSVATSVNNFWANGFTCVLTGARLTTTSEPTGLSIAGCNTVTLQSITSNIRASATGGTGLALISSTGEVLSLATNAASAAGDFTWTFTDATVATGSAIYFAYYDASNANVAVGYTLRTGNDGDLFKAGAGTLRNYGDASNAATCAFLGTNTSLDFVVQNVQYAPYLVITTTGSASPIEEYNWNGTGTTAAWDTTSKNWLVGGVASTYASSIDGIVNFGDGSVAKNVTVNEAIVANTVNVSDNYTYTVGGSATLTVANLNVEAAYTLTLDGTGTLSVDRLTGTGTIHLNAGSRFATATLATDNAEAALPVEGEGTLAIETVTVKGANGRVSFGLPTDNGSVQMTGGVVNYGGGVEHELDQLGLSYNGAQNSTVNVETDTTLHVVGTNVAYDNDHRMTSSMFLGHWNAQNTINVYGTLISEVALSGWDGKVAINVADGGRLELRDGLNRNKARAQAIDINVSSGGVVAAGTTHNTEHTQSHDSLSVNLSDGATFQAYYATGETTADLGGKLNFTDGTATLDVGGSTLTTTISGTLAGTGVIKKTGEGTLVLAGGNKALGDTISLTAGTLTFNSDVVLDISNMSYDTQGDAQVYQLVDIADGATYTGWDSLTKDSLAGVMVDTAIFKADGTVTLTTVKPHTVEWDPNWGLTGPEALSGEITETTALISSPYKDGNDVVVELTGAGNAEAFIYGVQNSDVNNTGTTYVTNVWIDAKEGTYKAIVGGSHCNNWGGGGALNLEGDTHIQLDGATVGTVIGGNLKDGQNPQFNGNSYISIVSGDVTAAIIGSSTNSHNATTTQTGDTHIFVYVPLAQSDVNPLPAGGGGSSAPKNQVIGASAHVDNTVGTATLNGSTHVTIDLSKYEGGTTSFVKTIIGGHFSDAAGHTQNISGDTNVTIMGGDIEFSGDIIGGNRNNNGTSTIGGSSALGITGGTYSGDIIGGNKITGSSTSTVGAVVVNLGGEAHINGSVYAAGYIATAGTAQDNTVASTTVNVGAGVEFGSGVLSGGFGGDGAARGVVSDGSVLNLTDAKEYTHLSTVTLDSFSEISAVKNASATITAITNTPWLTKNGEGALTLALGGESAIMSVEVSKGTLTLGAADMEIMGITVDSGATLTAAAGSSLQAAAITLNGGSTLSVGAGGLVLAEGSYLIMDGGKVSITATGTPGQEIVLVTGLTEEDSITGITFDKTDDSGNKYADSATYLELGTTLADYTQLKVKDGQLVLAKTSSGGNYWGAGKGAGTWDLTTENWAKDDGLEASGKFTNNAAAYFTTNGGGGIITVGEAINVTTINVSGAAYNFTGGQNLTITNGISVTDSGSATFDQVAGELKNVYIAGTESKLTIKNGDVIVNALSNEGTFITSGNLTVKNATAMGGNVTASNLILTGENTFDSVKVSDTVSGATSIKLGGESRITNLNLNGVGTLTLTDGTLKLVTTSGLEKTNLSGALETAAGVDLGSLTMNDASSITGHGAVSASGITVSGTANILAGTTLQTASVGGTGTLRVASGSTVGGSNLSVANNATLELLEGSTLANSGTLSVAGKVIAGNGVSLGTVDAKGTIELDGASVSATGGSIAALDMGSGETLTVANNLALTTTTGSAGTLSVTGGLTVGGAATIGNVTAGTLELTTAGTLTATGTLDAGTITLDRVSKTDHYLTAGGLSESTTAFVVDKALIEALNVSAGQIITLADLDTVHAGADNLTINGAKYITDTHDLGYYISQDSATKNIILIARNQESNYVWVGVNENWSDAANWSGGLVPDETSWVQFNGGEQSILLDQLVKTRRLTVSAGTHDTIYGDQNLLLTQSLEVDGNASLNVGDGSTETMVSAPEVQVSGELNVQENAFVDAGHTTIKGGVLNVADGGSYFTGVVDMTEGGSLYTEGEASIAAEQLNGDLDSTVGGKVTVYGNGGRYTGGYDGAYIDIVEDADATLYANDGLTLGGDGTAKLQYSGSTAIDGIDADALTIILNDPNASSIGSTLELNNTSLLEDGSVVFGMSAIESAKTLGAGAPAILQGDLRLGGDATVVVNQDASADGGQAMEVRNYGKTRSLELAKFGGAETDTQNVQLNGYLYGKYYMNARIEGGKLLVDMRDDFYRTVSGAHTPNGIAGAQMVDAAFVENNPQITDPAGDLAAVMTALENGAVAGEAADKALAAMSGASVAAMGAALGSDVDRQLRAVRNRTTSMGLNDCLVNEDLPYFNAWVNAEGDYRRLKADGTLAGYKLSSWGGTVGFDVDCTPRFTCGLALTAMKGNFTANAAESADGDLDRMYVSAFVRYSRHSLTQTLVGTFGRADAKLNRTVDYGAGAYRTEGDTDGTAFGVMYEIGYAKALNEDATTCLQPVLNLSYRHSTLGGFTEEGGSDAALVADDAEMNVFTAAVGARLQSVVGTSVYNRSTLFEGRVLLKMDSGDRDVAVRNHFVGVRNGADAKSAEVGAFGVEVGAGITLPLAEDGGSLFFDVTGEFRSGYSEVNGTAGYRFNF